MSFILKRSTSIIAYMASVSIKKNIVSSMKLVVGEIIEDGVSHTG